MKPRELAVGYEISWVAGKPACNPAAGPLVYLSAAGRNVATKKNFGGIPMGRRILNRKEMRADYDAAERRKQDDDESDETEDEAEDEADDEEEDAEAEDKEADKEGDEDEEAEVEEEAPKKKKPAKAKAKAKPRSRTPKVVRMKVVWGVFNNSNQRVATYEYPKRKEAQDHAAKLTNDKKSTHFVQPVKEPLEEKEKKE